MVQFFVDTQQDSRNQLTKDYRVATMSRSRSPPLCKTKLLTSCQCRLHRLALASEYDFSRDDIITKQLNSQPLRGPQPVPIQLGDLAGRGHQCSSWLSQHTSYFSHSQSKTAALRTWPSSPMCHCLRAAIKN